MPPAEMAASSAAFMLFRIRLATRTHHYIKGLAGPACDALLGLALGPTLTRSFQLLAEPSTLAPALLPPKLFPLVNKWRLVAANDRRCCLLCARLWSSRSTSSASTSEVGSERGENDAGNSTWRDSRAQPEARTRRRSLMALVLPSSRQQSWMRLAGLALALELEVKVEGGGGVGGPEDTACK
ncbi:hypothetical protein GSI_10349 [Ganoderma sinense ZZ0214-1]|uniref:Uncharacterized protein n=1 Tax=Ganoderma sinense ZZ0214-1 TaxID=1077348 RepID=A0A2G8S0C8_9APHY|nr:hypothetical protein GSI_10349 [Ganoderma sinense ZZ0214-1]